ncbi:MAG TPA: MMPL family transporter [Nocardioidaceae bacterium]|nr:MMPL family transporter [Nocardioidaceae bacterium]
MGKVLYALGRFCGRRPLWIIGVWLVVLVGVVGAVRVFGAQTGNNLELPGTGSQEVQDLLADRFPPQQNGTNPVVFHVKTGKLTDKQNSDAVTASVKALKKAPHVYSVTNPVSSDGQTAGLLSKDGRTGFAPVLLDINSGALDQETSERIIAAAKPAQDAGIEVAAGGSLGSELSTEGTESSEVVGILAAMFILTLVLGSVIAMGLPIIAAVIGLAIALSVIGLLGHVLAIPTTGATLATMIGLGVGIDYALFLISKHLDQLRAGVPMIESIARAVATSGSAIVFAGSTVVVALISLRVAKIPLLSTLGLASAVAVLTAVLGAITLLPALLGLLKHRIAWLHLPYFGHHGEKGKHGSPRRGDWRAWSGFLTRHPLVVSLVALAVLAPLIVPAFSLRFGQEDIGATPTSTTERQAYDLITAGFGVGYNGPLEVASKFDPVVSPSKEYTNKYNKATSLKSDLDKKQKELPAEQQQLEGQQQQLVAEKKQLQREQRSLEAQKNQLETEQQQLLGQRTTLEQEGADLQGQVAALERQAAQLAAQGAAFERQARPLEQRLALLANERNQLARQSQAVAARYRSIAAQLNQALARDRALVSQFASLADRPRLQAIVVRRLNALRAREQQLRAALVPLQRQGRVLADRAQPLASQAAALQQRINPIRARVNQLRAEANRLASQIASLERQAAALVQQGERLVAEEAALARQAAALEQEGTALQQQADALQQEGAALQQQADQLKAEQQQAEQEESEAKQLQKELTAMVTKAGGDPRNTDPRVVRLQNALLGTAGVTALTPPQTNKKGDVVLLSAVPTTSPASVKTADLLATVRDSVVPAVEKPGGITSYVGGYTASYVDLATLISERLLLVIGTVILLGFVLLMIAFRSLLIPLQAAVTNLLSAAAAFGILTAAFQWGWGIDLLGIDTTSSGVPIASYVPLMMFAVLFGLSMDYEVFLVSNVQQHHLRGEPARTAVESGLTTSARITTAAALIMTSVFASFILNGDPTIKQFGVGLASAVFLAGIMVITLAPAAIVLMGEAAWWLPRWLDRLLPHVNLEGEETPAEAPEPPTPETPAPEAPAKEPAAEEPVPEAPAPAARVVPFRVPSQRTPEEPAGRPPATTPRNGRDMAP